MKLCSACLLGVKCKYNGESNVHKASDKILREYRNGKLIPVCPEQLGGLTTPRVPSRISEGDGSSVLDGEARVVRENGVDITEQFVRGARQVLKILRDVGIDEAILKQRSPSCGNGRTQSWEGEDKVVDGDGVTAALLRRNGVELWSEEDY